MLYKISVSHNQWNNGSVPCSVQELPRSGFAHYVLCSLEVSWSTQSTAQGSTSHSECTREADQLRKLMCDFVRDLYRMKKAKYPSPELFNAKSPRRMFRKRCAGWNTVGKSKRKQWGQKCSLIKSLAKTKLRGGTLMNLNRDLMEFGKEQGKGLHPGRIMPCSAQALLWRAWACSRSQADHTPQHAHTANLAGRYWTLSGVWSADQGRLFSSFSGSTWNTVICHESWALGAQEELNKRSTLKVKLLVRGGATSTEGKYSGTSLPGQWWFLRSAWAVLFNFTQRI